MTSFGVLSSRALETRDGTTRRELIHRLLSKKPRDLARVIRSMMYHHELAHKVLMYLQPGTMSPISLMELGLVAGNGRQTVVVCPDGFWRKGNVDVICARNGCPVFQTLDEAIAEIGDPPDWSYDQDGPTLTER